MTQIFDTIRNPDLPWPPGNAGTTEYVFRCFYSSPRETFPLFRFHYTDFRGDDLQGDTTQILDVRKNVIDAHTVVFLLDGQKILDALNRTPVKGFSINDDLDTISDLAMDCIRKPMQFVITKADVLSAHSFEKIRHFLLEHPKFSFVVRERRDAGRPAYLIPISAVGENFARYDAVSKSIVKRPDASPQPYNLEVTLALVITDTLLGLIKDRLKDGDPKLGLFLRGLIGTGQFVNWVTKIGIINAGDPWSVMLLVMLNGVNNRVISAAEQKKLLLGITDKKTALHNITQLQHSQKNEFLAQFPAANLLHVMEDH